MKHTHTYGGQTLRHEHEHGEVEHGYYEHPEDGVDLAARAGGACSTCRSRKRSVRHALLSTGKPCADPWHDEGGGA